MPKTQLGAGWIVGRCWNKLCAGSFNGDVWPISIRDQDHIEHDGQILIRADGLRPGE